MADENTDQSAEKPKSKLPLIIGGVAVVLLLAVGGGFFLGVFGGGGENEAAHGEEDGELHGESSGDLHGEGGEGGGMIYYDLQEIIVNLNVGSASPSFLKMKISLELANALDVPSIEAQLPRIRDSFHVYIRELRRTDLQGSEGIYRLREELLLRINKIVHPIKVRDILFKEILIQ